MLGVAQTASLCCACSCCSWRAVPAGRGGLGGQPESGGWAGSRRLGMGGLEGRQGEGCCSGMYGGACAAAACATWHSEDRGQGLTQEGDRRQPQHDVQQLEATHDGQVKHLLHKQGDALLHVPAQKVRRWAGGRWGWSRQGAMGPWRCRPPIRSAHRYGMEYAAGCTHPHAMLGARPCQ